MAQDKAGQPTSDDTTRRPAPQPTQQVDDNQDDVGRDVNKTAEPSTNEVRPDKLSKTPRP